MGTPQGTGLGGDWTKVNWRCCAAEKGGAHWVCVTSVTVLGPQVPGAGVAKGLKPLSWTWSHMVSILPHAIQWSQSCHMEPSCADIGDHRGPLIF